MIDTRVASTNLSLGFRRRPGGTTSVSAFDLRNAVIPAIRNRGSARTATERRSPSQGSSQNPATNGPRMEPTKLTAYAVPARSGSPPDHESTSNGVRNPAMEQNRTMPASRNPANSDPPSLKGTSGSTASSGMIAKRASKLQARSEERRVGKER